MVQTCENLATKTELEELRQLVNSKLGKAEAPTLIQSIIAGFGFATVGQMNILGNRVDLVAKKIPSVEQLASKAYSKAQTSFSKASDALGRSQVAIQQAQANASYLTRVFNVALAALSIGTLAKQLIDQKADKIRMDTIESEVKFAQETANDSFRQAMTARAEARTAQGQADTATQTAYTATQQANTAIESANQSARDANAAYIEAKVAQNKADIIARNAESAQVRAEQAYDKAEVAIAEVEPLKLQLNVAINNSNAAKKQAEDAKFAASYAQSLSSLAQKQAQNALSETEKKADKEEVRVIQQTFGSMQDNIAFAEKIARDARDAANRARGGGASEVEIRRLELIALQAEKGVIELRAKTEKLAGDVYDNQAITNTRLKNVEDKINTLKTNVTNTFLNTTLINNIVNNTPLKDEFDKFKNSTNTKIDNLTKTYQNTQNVDNQKLNQLSQDLNKIDNLLAVIAIPLLLQTKLNTSFDKITNAASTGVCRTTKPGGCMSNLVKNEKPNWFDVGNAGANAASLIQGDKILGIVKDTNSVVRNKTFGLEAITKILKNAKYGLEATQKFAEKAWTTLKLDKALAVMTFVMSTHNALMLSKNLGQTFGDVATEVLRLFKVKNPIDQSDIDVNEVIGNAIKEGIISIVGKEAYTNATSTFNKLNRILVAAQGVVWAIRSMKDAVLEVAEQTFSLLAKFINNTMLQGLMEDGWIKWQHEQPGFRGKFSKFYNKVDNLDDAANVVQGLVSGGNEIIESGTELTESLTNLTKAYDDFDKDKTAKEDKAAKENASPTIQNKDLVKKEGDS